MEEQDKIPEIEIGGTQQRKIMIIALSHVCSGPLSGTVGMQGRRGGRKVDLGAHAGVGQEGIWASVPLHALKHCKDPCNPPP